MNTKIKGEVIKKHNTCAVIKVEHRKIHKIYGKQYMVTKKIHADDPKNEVNIGDTVEAIETRPISKLKHWKISKIINKS